MDIRKILWPNDFSDTAHRVIPYVTSLVEKYGADLYLLHVALDLSDYGHYWGKPDSKHVEGMHQFARVGAKKKLAEFCQDELAVCPTYHIHIELGDPAQMILKTAEELQVDLIVLPLNGGPKRSRLGAVAQEVLIKSSVPVMAIRPKIDAGRSSER